MKMKAFALAAALCAAPGVAAFAADGSCVACHEKGGASTAVEHGFADWKDSSHARAGVDCQACHGGNPAETDKAKAHAGILRSTDKKSPLYFTRVPETCGSCHQAEKQAFESSPHGKALQRTGQGPNCVTCHGAMANRVLAPRDMEMTCTLCHRRPTQAYLARMALDDSGATLKKLRVALRAAQDGGAATQAREKDLVELEKAQRAATVDWHAFDMPKVLSESREVKDKARAALEDLRAKK
jgi:hypothetical protein